MTGAFTVTIDQAFTPLPPLSSGKRQGGGTQLRYEAGRRTQQNREQWRNVDGLSPNAVNDPATRANLRNRSRAEDDNGTIYPGLINDRANETIGTGPRLQLTLPHSAASSENAHKIEQLWQDHCDKIGLLDKLLILDKSETRDGEVFGLMFINPVLPDQEPQLDLQLYEADQCTSPDVDFAKPGTVDGIVLDRYGNPIEYHFLRQHPGDIGIGWLGKGEWDPYPANRVLHFFTPKRAGQARGVPGLQSSLALYGTKRGLTEATLNTVKAQSQISAAIEQDNTVPTDEEPWESPDTVVAGNTHFFVMPPGARAKDFPHNSSNSSYAEFSTEITTEAGRPISAPQSISTGSSAPYNYASGRLDLQRWVRAIKIRRKRIVRIILAKLFNAWVFEALMIPGFLPAGLPPLKEWRREWRWDGFVSIDPVKDAQADEIRLRSGTTTMDVVYGERGEDWEDQLVQRLTEEKVEMELRAKMGLPPKAAAAPAPPSQRNGVPSRNGKPQTVPPDDDEEEQEDEE